MKKISTIIILSFNLLFLFCSKESNPIIHQNDDVHNGYLQIQTEKSNYFLSTTNPNASIHVTGTVTNATQDTFYSKLGDAFNLSIDPDLLLIAYKTDGYFEYYNEDKYWENVEQGRLIEGSSVIRILPETQYIMQASAIINTNKTGKFRLRIQYYRSYSEAEVDTLQDISNTFTIEIENN